MNITSLLVAAASYHLAFFRILSPLVHIPGPEQGHCSAHQCQREKEAVSCVLRRVDDETQGQGGDESA